MASTLIQRSSPYPHWEFIQQSTGDRLRIVPDRGGLVSEWLCNGREMLYLDKLRFADLSKSVRGGIPILFPICGNLPSDLLRLDIGQFRLKQHGFARDSRWKLDLLDDHSGVLLSLRETATTLQLFPFYFLLEMVVRPLMNELYIQIIIHNNGHESMPYSFGLHPYFLVKDLSRARIEGLPQTCFDHLKMVEVSTSSELACLEKGVDFLSNPSGPVTLFDEVDGTRLALHQKEPLNPTVVWTDPPRQMVCLEPWTAPRNSLLTGIRKLMLKAGEKQILQCSFKVDN